MLCLFLFYVDFGEICIWLGMYLLCSSGYSTIQQQVIGSLSPLFSFTLLVYVSGINLLEATGAKRWGGEEGYKTYIANTPVLIPLIGRRGDAAF